MNEIIKVGNHNVVEIQWKGRKVITTAQLAEVYETDANNVQANFGRNQERFKEGVHYFLLKGQELREFKDYLTDSQLVAKNAPLLYLWTHRGASRHCKILDTEKAWEQFDNLEEAYFNPQSSINMDDLDPDTQLMNLLVRNISKQELEQKRQAKEQERQAAELKEVKENQRTIAQALIKPAEVDFRTWVNSCLSAIAESEGYLCIGSVQERHRAVRTESYERLNRKRPCRLDLKVKNAKGNAAIAGANDSQLNAINKLTVIEKDKDLRPVYEAVIREMLAAYRVNI